MRRIICLVLALCLFPFAGFAQGETQPSDVHSVWQQFRSAVQETDAKEAAAPTPTPSGDTSENDSQSSDVYSVWQQFRSAAQETDAAEAAATSTPTPLGNTSKNEPQPMDGMMFLHRLLFALDLLEVEYSYFSRDPWYCYSPSTGDGYLEFDTLFLTFDHIKRTIKMAEGYYVTADGIISDNFAQGLPALLFALGPYNMADESWAFYYQQGESFLDDYKDPSTAKALIQQAQNEALLLGDYYLTADHESYYLVPSESDPQTISTFYSADDCIYKPGPGLNSYCLFIRYAFARYILSITDYNDYPLRDYSPEGYACYTIGPHIELFVNRTTGIEPNPIYLHTAPFEEIPLDDLKDILAFYFAICGRSIEEEIYICSENAILQDYDHISQLQSVILEYFAPGNVAGDYRMHTEHYTHSHAITHTYFGAGINYDK